MSSARAACGSLALLAGLSLTAPPALSEAIEVRALPIVLSEHDPTHRSVGALDFRGGLRLTSSDRRFGGWSGLHVSDDGGRLTAVGDQGSWLMARLEYAPDGRLADLSGAELGSLHGLDGQPLSEKRTQDAESLARLADGAWLVGFERWHRVWSYRTGERPLDGRPVAFGTPPGLEAAPANGGLEALAALPDGRLVALTEEVIENGLRVGWVGRGARWEKLSYRTEGAPAPAGMTALPSGDLLVLERAYTPREGNTIRLRLVPADTIAPGAVVEGRLLAEIRPPLNVDNFEGIASRRDEHGTTLVYLVSDDNFTPTQRTLLLLFALRH